MGIEAPKITAAVRTGDTTSSERASMLRTPPHILVTTPESLYLLLTAERSRAMLRTVRTVIVDEIHALIGSRRGAHLALSLERLQQVAERPLGVFSRQLFLGDTLDTEKVSASYDAGVLTLRIPVAEQAKPRRIEISNADTGVRQIDA